MCTSITRGLKPDLDFDAIGRGMRVKIKEGMLVTHQFALDFLEKFVHGCKRSIRAEAIRATLVAQKRCRGNKSSAFQDEAATGSPASSSPRSFISAITFSKAPSALASKSTK